MLFVVTRFLQELELCMLSMMEVYYGSAQRNVEKVQLNLVETHVNFHGPVTTVKKRKEKDN